MCHRKINQQSKQSSEFIQIILGNSKILDPFIKARVLQAGAGEQMGSRASLLQHGRQRIITGSVVVHDVVKVVLETLEVVGDLGGGGGGGVGVGLKLGQIQLRRGQVQLTPP